MVPKMVALVVVFRGVEVIHLWHAPTSVHRCFFHAERIAFYRALNWFKTCFSSTTSAIICDYQILVQAQSTPNLTDPTIAKLQYAVSKLQLGNQLSAIFVLRTAMSMLMN